MTPLLILMCYGANGAGRPPDVSDVVAYARQIDVAKIDAALKPESLELWLSSRELNLDHVRWSRGDCDIRPDESPSKHDYPLCVRIDFRCPNGWGWMSLKIGTIHKGIRGRPELLHCVVKSRGFPRHGAFHGVKKLSEFRAVLDAVDADAHRR
ncbi:MAG TPA: hypothetical protein VLC46_19865 [Thermoanaerobaculia bacterium]|jgi:hypothetical protein|nr:hypothetical protein [Thermoanaerobaculia bacterium]